MNKAQMSMRMWAALGMLTVGVGVMPAAAKPGAPVAVANTKKEVLALTNNRRVKVVWNQDAEGGQVVKLFDTKDGTIADLDLVAGSAPLISKDGLRIFNSSGKAPAERAVFMYDIAKKKITELAKGPGNNLMAIWQDPKTKKEWCYVNDSGDKGEGWNVPAGKIFRFPVDKPEARELFWDRTSSHIYLMFSEDGTRACFEPSWANIGQLKLAFTADGKVDQDKSEFKAFGGGCFPSMAPDNSYRLFRLDGDHSSVSMCDADNKNQRKVAITDMLKQRKLAGNCWLTRWSTDASYITLIAPAGAQARIWLGKLDSGATKIEKWVPISVEGGKQCWQSQAWVEPKR